MLFQMRCADLRRVLVVLICCLSSGRLWSVDNDWIPLFDGKDLNGWYSYLPSVGKNNDPQSVFKVERGMIHVLDVPVTKQRQEEGYLSTNQEYSDVIIHAEYKWGTKRFPPHAHGKRDSGLLYLVVGRDIVFPRCLELQIEETDTGDLWVVDGISVASWTKDPSYPFYDDDQTDSYLHVFTSSTHSGRHPVLKSGEFEADRIIKSGDFEDRAGWNTVEVVLNGNSVTQIVNGRVVNAARDVRQPDPQNPSRMIPLTSGRIALEAEGAEVWFRNVKIKHLKTPN